ncbi:NAD-dependent deacylase [Luteimonas chenhongjianii]|uniref:NAD-dependent protein deacylase n=1 Tax=Luteimonas chenhongjianii TaxID=2006110 RepID=A0A290XHA0_9GAMM|nr:NAD-dependent protein deacylase [Luteimonas chenhongjianii]ATD68453.1 NAD-dependent deacylase [Luteimonas chenhongjianii]
MRIVVLSGAGISAASGVPTFRDALTGLWARFDPERLATEAAFRADPALVWGWYRWRAAMVAAAAPNAAHADVAALADDGHALTVVTQNVDDLHERGGARDVLHLHGRLLASRCIDCGARATPDPILLAPASPAGGQRETPPSCDRCGAAFRPDVVWFGEALPVDAWEAASRAIEACDLLVVVGTSSLVWPAAGLPDRALRLGTPVLEINPQPTPLSPRATAHWALTATAGMAQLRARLSAGAWDVAGALRFD